MTDQWLPPEANIEISTALKNAIDRVSKPGANIYPGAIRSVLKNLAESGKIEWDRGEYESIRDRIVKDKKN